MLKIQQQQMNSIENIFIDHFFLKKGCFYFLNSVAVESNEMKNLFAVLMIAQFLSLWRIFNLLFFFNVIFFIQQLNSKHYFKE